MTNKFKLIILFLIIIFMIFSYKVYALEDTYDVILFWGQSNMVGYAGLYSSTDGKSGEDVYDSRVSNLGVDKYSQITEIDKSIINNYTTMKHVNVDIDDGIGFEYLYKTNSLDSLNKDTFGEKMSYIDGNLVSGSFATGTGYFSIQESYGTNIIPQFVKEYYKKTGHKVVAVICANGGEEIAHFLPHDDVLKYSLYEHRETDSNKITNMKSQYIYEAMITKYKAAIKYLSDNGYNIGNKIYVVFQGENDVRYILNDYMTSEDYYNVFMMVHNNLKRDCDISLGGIIETAATIGSTFSKGVYGVNVAHEKLIKNNKDIILASDYPFRKYVPEPDAYYNTDYESALNNAKYSVCITERANNAIHFTSAALSQIGLESANNIANYLNNNDNSKLAIRDYNLNNSTGVLKILSGSTVANVSNKIDYNGTFNFIDNNGVSLSDDSSLKTGSILRTKFMNRITNYKIAVNGDVFGTGKIENAGIRRVVNHIIDGNVITGDEYLSAADYNNDNIIKMNDVMKMALSIKDNDISNDFYTINYDFNGGVDGPNKQTFKYNDNDKISMIIPKRIGYTFINWKIDGSDETLNPGDSIPTDNHELRLIAEWRINKAYIKINMNGGTLADNHGTHVFANGNSILFNNSDIVQSIEFNNKTNLNGLVNYNNASDINVSKVGYVAKNKEEWNTQADGSGKSYDQDMVYNASEFCDLTDGDCTITLYVNWIPKTLTVEFVKNTTSSDTSSVRQQFVYGNEYNSELKKGNRFGYNTDGSERWEQTGQFGKWDYANHTLLGWNTDANATSRKYQPYSTVTDSWINTNYPYIKLYAIWQ